MVSRTNLGYALDAVLMLIDEPWLDDEERRILEEAKDRLETAMRLLYGEMEA